MLPAGFKPVIPANDRLYVFALDRSVTGLRFLICYIYALFDDTIYFYRSVVLNQNAPHE